MIIRCIKKINLLPLCFFEKKWTLSQPKIVVEIRKVFLIYQLKDYYTGESTHEPPNRTLPFFVHAIVCSSLFIKLPFTRANHYTFPAKKKETATWKKEKAQQGKKKETANLISSCKKKYKMYVFSFLNHLIKLKLLQFAMINRQTL